MAGTSRSLDTKLSFAAKLALVLLFLSIFINYVDRGNLSIAAPLLQTELGISNTQLGLLLSSFFWTYAACQILSGWLVSKFNPCWVLALGFFAWSAATAVTGVIQGFTLLLIVRLLLGIGESVAYPAYSKILASDFAEHHRGVANSIIDAGAKLGPAAGTLAGGMLMAKFGWRPFFIVLGVVSLLWVPLWIKYMPKGHGVGQRQILVAPTTWQILSKRAAWATFFGLFSSNYLWYFLLTWLPSYLVKARHYSMREMAGLGALCYITTACSTMTTAWFAYRWLLGGASCTRVRKGCTSIGLLGSSIILLVPIIEDRTLSMVILLLACASFGIYTSSLWAITQTVAGPRAAGKWTGFQNAFGNLAGVSAPAVTGFVVDKTGSFYWAFVVVAGIVLAGACVYAFMLENVEEVQWEAPPVPAPALVRG